MRRNPTIALSAFALTLALGVSGCSSSSSSDDSSSSSSESSSSASTPSSTPSATTPADFDVTPAAGATISGDGYTYTVPEGWAQQDESVAPGTDTAVADVSGSSDFANNVNVILSPAGKLSPNQVEKLAVNELEGAGATDLTVEPRVTIAGSESAHIAANMTSSGLTYRVHQYYATTDDQTYVITFSFGQSVPDEQAVEISESILATWTWS